MTADRSEFEHRQFWRGAMLGGAQAHAILGTPLAALMLFAGHLLLGFILMAGAAFGWWAWWDINRLHLQPTRSGRKDQADDR